MTITHKRGSGHSLANLACSFLLVSGLTTTVSAQQSVTEHQSHTANPSTSSKVETPLAEQLQQLHNKVAQLEAVLQQNHQAAATTGQTKMKMGGMQGGSTSGMGMMSSMGSQQPDKTSGSMSMGGMKNMPMMGGMSGMDMMGGKGMMMMGKMQGMGQQAMPSALPGFPGASHIYHIGSTNFFLDHPQHITLTQEQQLRLNQIKQKAILGQTTFERWDSAAEQELWLLTSADSPDVSKIEEKVRETEKLRADKRIAFIRAVGEAASVLTEEQRQTLVGTLPLDHTSQGQSH